MKKYWETFLAETGREGSYVRTICFGMEKTFADRAAERVRSGEKWATIYPAEGYLRRRPHAGDLNIVCAWNEKPRAVIETTSAETILLRDLTDVHVRLENDAADLAAWKESCLEAIRIELEELGLELTDETPLVVEKFRTIYTGE